MGVVNKPPAGYQRFVVDSWSEPGRLLPDPAGLVTTKAPQDLLETLLLGSQGRFAGMSSASLGQGLQGELDVLPAVLLHMWRA